MKEKFDTSDFKYCTTDTLFNVVLRCAEDTLLLVNNQPACKYEKILIWHELSMQLGEDLFTTALIASFDAKHDRLNNNYLWSPYIKATHSELDKILRKPLTELHAHLKGSSLNFDLNWMCLMNHIQNRAKDFELFEIRQHEQVIVGMEEQVSDLYHQVMKASAIRIFLFAMIKGHGEDAEEILMEMLHTKSRIEATYCCSRLQELIDSYRQMYGKKYHRESTGYDIVDYSISKESSYEEKELLISILAGEREFLYLLMKRCFEGKLNQLQEGLLIAYLVIKTQLRQEMVQLNTGVGFDNFATYEVRKTAFIKEGTVYDRLIAQLAIGNFLKSEPTKRYMEARIVPKEKANDVLCQINKTDSDVRNGQFDKGKGWNYNYIYHFIKTADNTKEQLYELVPRHYWLREKVKRQAHAIYQYRNFNLAEDNARLVGIDAANSEILARPEVFAQAFRYLRNHTISDNVHTKPKELGFTYHVGEDFMDVADGLRAYDEVIRFMGFRKGDRLGHALVLGVDVQTYYKRRNYVIAMPLQMILDNTVWLYKECKSINGSSRLLTQLENDYGRFFGMVYGESVSSCSLNNYYYSWLLRGDNPFCYQKPSDEPALSDSVDEWEMKNLVVGDQEVEDARKDEIARFLYRLYHFDKGVKKNGAKVVEYQVTENYVNILEAIRIKKLKDAKQRHLAIECNPTSNYKIGEFSDFSEHPITTFYNKGLSIEEDKHRISVSINTDDAGVFATSLEREYAVMMRALEEKYSGNKKLSPQQVFDWLNDVRKFGQQQRFT